jgi:antirestriction protein ArdC
MGSSANIADILMQPQFIMYEGFRAEDRASEIGCARRRTMTRDEAYHAVLLHEATHATGHETRCDRKLTSRFKNHAYAAEELVAEIGSAFLCAELGITQDTRADHAQYIANWLQLLKDDPKAIFTAAAKASEAVTWLKKQQPQ